jgi:DNA-binding MarR family transcriptional regulator
MNEELTDQASEVERLFPQIGRRLFTIHPDDPAADLPVTQLRVCTLLRNGPATMSALGDDLGISMSAVTQIADRLERAGLVARVAEADDRRMKKLLLTAHGEEVMQARWERRVECVSAALATLTDERRADVLCALRDLFMVTTNAVATKESIS